MDTTGMEDQIKTEYIVKNDNYSCFDGDMFVVYDDFRTWDSTKVVNWLQNSLEIDPEKINTDLWTNMGINGLMLEIIDDDMLKEDLEVKSRVMRKYIFK